MKCGKCNELAVVHIAEFAAGKLKSETHFCRECSPVETSSGEILRLKVCPLCEYSLAGLPAEGICPECGRSYDAAQIYLYGNALGVRRNSWNAILRGPKQIIWYGMFTAAMVAFFVLPRANGGINRIVDVFVAGWFATNYLLAVLRGLSDQGSGSVQVKLCDAGIRQGTRGLGPLPFEANQKGRLVPWRKVKDVQFKWRGWYGEVQFTNRKAFWRPYLLREYVHANFTCTKTEFRELRKRVRQWLTQNNCAAALERMSEDAQTG